MTVTNISKRLGIAGAIVGLIEGQNQFFDYIVYPAVILWLGSIKGGLVMIGVALIINFLVVYWYRNTTQDWFGLEWLKVQETIGATTRFGRFLQRLLRFGKWPAYIAISIYDPAYGFIFLRGREGQGPKFKKADWFWFIITTVIANLVWILLVSGVIGAIRQVI